MPSAMQKKQLPFPGRRSSERNPKATKNNSYIVLKKTASDISCRTRRFKNGAKAIKEIKAMQHSTRCLISKSSFCRVVREIMNSFSSIGNGFRIQPAALEALQEAAEMYLVQFFEDSLLCTLHAKRVTLMQQDCHLMRRLRGPSEVGNK